MKTLKNILAVDNLNITSNPLGTDKGDEKSYIDKYYERTFEKYRFVGMRLLEIGFRHGASLALWSEYFKDGEIVGCDNFTDASITETTRPLSKWIERDNVTTLVGDAYDPKFAASLDGTFDIIIDDGPHSLASQCQAIELYADNLRPGGILIIEDILTGGASIGPLLENVPKWATATFHDFRWHKWAGDNCLFIVTRKKPTLLSNARIIAQRTFYALTEVPARRIKQMLANAKGSTP